MGKTGGGILRDGGEKKELDSIPPSLSFLFLFLQFPVDKMDLWPTSFRFPKCQKEEEEEEIYIRKRRKTQMPPFPKQLHGQRNENSRICISLARSLPVDLIVLFRPPTQRQARQRFYLFSYFFVCGWYLGNRDIIWAHGWRWKSYLFAQKNEKEKKSRKVYKAARSFFIRIFSSTFFLFRGINCCVSSPPSGLLTPPQAAAALK